MRLTQNIKYLTSFRWDKDYKKMLHPETGELIENLHDVINQLKYEEELQMTTTTTNAKRNNEMLEQLIDLKVGEMHCSYELYQMSEQLFEDSRAIINAVEELQEKYEHYTKRAAMLSDLHGYEYDEALMPTYTLVAYEDEGQYKFIEGVIEVRTNKQINTETCYLLEDLYYALQEEAHEVDMDVSVSADSWEFPENRTLMALLANTETEIRRHYDAEHESEYWSEKNDRPEEERRIPHTTLIEHDLTQEQLEALEEMEGFWI